MQEAQTVSCVGRETELAQLFEWYREARESRLANLAVLVGARGIGKSKLLGALRAKARLAGGVVLEGRSDNTCAFGPFASIVAQALRFLDEVGQSFSADDGALGCAAGCHALWYEHRDLTCIDGIDCAGQRERLFEGVAQLLARVAQIRTPIVLIHDLAETCHGTLDLVRSLLDAGSPLAADFEQPLSMMIATCLRIDELPSQNPRIEVLLAHDAAHQLVVGALSEAGVRALLSSSETIQQVLARTGGAPDAIRRLLAATPPSHDEHVHNVLARLPLAAVAAVQALSVRGKPARCAELERIMKTPLDGAARRALEQIEWLEVQRSQGDSELCFSHAAELQSVLNLVEPQRSRELHGDWLALLEQDAGDGADLVRHALGAGHPARAVELALSAARSLAMRLASHEATELLESVLPSAQGEHADALRGELVALYRATGEYRRGLVHARLLRDQLPTDPERQRALCDLLVLAGELDQADEALGEVRTCFGAALAPALRAELEALHAEVALRRADYDSAENCAMQALAHDAGDVKTTIAARNTLGKIELARDDKLAAATWFELNAEAAARAGLPALESQACTNLGYATLDRKAPRAALALFERALSLATSAGDARRRAVATEALAVCAHLVRDYRRAREHYQSALVLLRRVNTPAMVAGTATNLGELYLTLGETRRAHDMCELATQVGGTRLAHTLRSECMLLRGRVATARGDLSSARASLETARAWMLAQQDHRVDEVQLALAEVELEEGEVSAARRRLATLAERESGSFAARLAILVARIERACAGEVASSAERAARLAEGAGDDELRVPALTLLARSLLDDGQGHAARHAIEQALLAERRLTATVPEDLLGAFGERRIRVELERVARATGEPRAPTNPARSQHGTRAVSSDEQLMRWAERYPRIIGRSARMCDVLRVIDRAAASDMQVLVRGESGTGKELVAEALHAGSARHDKPFIRMNCAAIVESLLLSELFGHERGAFTGAAFRRRGRFEVAHGGTLFLDEIGDISLATQAALLRVLQEGEFERVGGTQTLKVDVRIVAATHRDLEAMVRAGTFREDLYYRLRGITIEMPPLRARREDIAALCQHLLGALSADRTSPLRMTGDALAALMRHDWPGNVRELDNVLRNASLFCEDGFLHLEAVSNLLPAQEQAWLAECVVIQRESAASGSTEVDPCDPVYDRIRGGHTSLFEMKKQLERECIQRALRETGGNITRAASLLGMKRPRLSQLVKEYELSSLAERV